MAYFMAARCTTSFASRKSLTTCLAPIFIDHAPSWSELHNKLVTSEDGARLQLARSNVAIGGGEPSSAANIRLFDKDEADVRVTFYRDAAAWCPYCQKVWLLLEEKGIPYRVSKLPLNAYGDKPAAFTRRVASGALPAIELDGEMHTESLEILRLLDETFAAHAPQMVPNPGSSEAQAEAAYLALAQELMRDWFSYVFYPVEGNDLDRARKVLLGTLKRVDEALGRAPGPWFLGSDHPTLVDLQYISHIERMLASLIYWRGLKVRGTGSFPSMDAWLAAFEERPAYLATKSDLYTIVLALPSQNGPGYFSTDDDDADALAARSVGLDGAWQVPVGTAALVEPLAPAHAAGGDAAAKLAAAEALVANHEAVVRFACRGAADPGSPSYHAELADPNCEPNEAFVTAVDVSLRHVTAALIEGTGATEVSAAAESDLAGAVGTDAELAEGWEEYEDRRGRTYWWYDATGESTYTRPTRNVDACLAYLRDRIGVPRDLGPAAAMQLRAHLNWAIGLLVRPAAPC